MKPSDFHATSVLNRDTHYQVEDGASKGTHAGSGTLQVGRVVWSQQSPEEQVPGQVVSCYAEGVGIVSLNAADLRSVGQS